MPTILTEEERERVKAAIPKTSYKIAAVAYTRLYIAYPDKTRWTYTGVEGAIALIYDLSEPYGTWLQLVDISPAARGLLWEQEIHDKWNYSQDRTFFHSFEIEDCLAGLSFADEKEARMFLKKIQERDKNAPVKTRNAPLNRPAGAGNPKFEVFDELYDPKWREEFPGLLDELAEMGITDSQIHENQDFILSYLNEAKAKNQGGVATSRAPPPPPRLLPVPKRPL